MCLCVSDILLVQTVSKIFQKPIIFTLKISTELVKKNKTPGKFNYFKCYKII